MENRFRSVLVTGASGFIGAPLTRALVSKGVRVVATGRRFSLTARNPSVLRIEGDLRHAGFCRRLEAVIRRNKVEAIYHLAAESESTVSVAPVNSMLESNVGLTQSVLEMARRTRARYFLFASTAKVYGTIHPTAVRESDIPRPETIYASTKLAAEALVQGYARTFGFSHDIVRLSNVYGLRSSPSTVVGRVIHLLRNKKPLRFVNLAAVRDFVFMDDVVSALLALSAHPPSRDGRVLNVSTGVATTVLEMVEIARGIFNRSQAFISGGQKLGDVLVLSQRLMRRTTGWKPEWSISRGLAQCQKVGKI